MSPNIETFGPERRTSDSQDQAARNESSFRYWVSMPKPDIGDLVAAVSVALLLVPQSMAYAQIAGMPLITGLYASVLPLILCAPFGSSPYLQTGPVALTSLLTFAALQGAGLNSSDADYVKMAALLALVVGLIRLLMGVFKLGWLAFLISEPVMQGFTSAAAVIIIGAQLPRSLGATETDGSTLGKAAAALSDPGGWSITAICLAATTLLVMLGGRNIHRLFPGVFVAVALGLAFTKFAGSDVTTIGDSYNIPSGFLSLSLNLPWGATSSILVGGFVIAVVGFSEPASISRIFAKEDNQFWDANRELVSSAAANFASGISGSFPVGGSFSRSAIGRRAGAKTVWSRVFVGVIVAGFLPFANSLADLPMPVLGAVVIGAVLGLIKPFKLLGLWQRSRLEALLAWATFALTLIFAPNIQWAVIAGVALSALYHFVLPVRLEVESRTSPAGHLRSDPDTDSEALVLKPKGLLWIASNSALIRQIKEAVSKTNHGDAVVDFCYCATVDSTTVKAVEETASKLSTDSNSISLRNLP